MGTVAMPEAAAGPIKVLVIDDSNTIRRSAEMFLRQAGFEVILAEDGFDALAKISDHQPRVIFVDIMMPRLDGYQTCALIKQNPQLKSTPVIMLSSKDGVFDRARGRLAGSDRYLTKPFTKEGRSEEHTSELQSRSDLVCRLLLEKKKKSRETLQRFQDEMGRLEGSTHSKLEPAVRARVDEIEQHQQRAPNSQNPGRRVGCH